MKKIAVLALLFCFCLIAHWPKGADCQIGRPEPTGGSTGGIGAGNLGGNNGQGDNLGGDNLGGINLGGDSGASGSGEGSGRGGGGGSHSEPNRYVAFICASDQNLSSDCLSQSTGEASAKLAKIIAKTVVDDELSVRFPEQSSRITQLQLLVQIENKAIDIVKAKLNEDVHRLRPFPNDTQEQRQQKQESIERWENEAKEQADGCENWTPDESTHDSHKYRLGPAYGQLKKIQAGVFKGRTQNRY